MREIKVMAVCGFGVGSSMILKMKIDEIVREHQLMAEVFTADVGTAAATPCDVIFTSYELGETLQAQVRVPVVMIARFVNKGEIAEKGLPVLQQLCNA